MKIAFENAKLDPIYLRKNLKTNRADLEARSAVFLSVSSVAFLHYKNKRTKVIKSTKIYHKNNKRNM